MKKSFSRVWRVIHWVIIVNFLLQICYGTAMIFFVFTSGSKGPLFAKAAEMPFELMVTRRLYAVETWIAISGLAIYLAITEILPRILATRGVRTQTTDGPNERTT
jgi:hypothetical protein